MTKRHINPTDAHVGARIRARRLDLGMSQDTLGNRLKLTFQQVQKYENGANRVSASRLLDIGNALGVSPAFFFQGLKQVDGARDAAAGALANRFFALPGAAEMARDFIDIPHRADRDAIATVVAIAANATRGRALQAAE